MKALGEFLRKARETRGLSLQEVQDVTKIRLFFLESIENGDFDVLPGQAYVKGFLRNYAAAVGLSAQEVIDRYHQLSQEQAKAEPTPAEAVAAPAAPVKVKTAKPKEPKAPQSKLPIDAKNQKNLILPAVVIVLGIIAGIFGSRYIVRHDSKSDQSVTTTVSQPTPVVKTKSVDNVVVRSEFADVLRVEATEDAWIRLTESDTGRMIEEIRLRKGDKRQWKIAKAVTLLNGNAGGLLISDKGEPFKYHGNQGEVVTSTFTPSANE